METKIKWYQAPKEEPVAPQPEAKQEIEVKTEPEPELTEPDPEPQLELKQKVEEGAEEVEPTGEDDVNALLQRLEQERLAMDKKIDNMKEYPNTLLLVVFLTFSQERHRIRTKIGEAIFAKIWTSEIWWSSNQST